MEQGIKHTPFGTIDLQNQDKMAKCLASRGKQLTQRLKENPKFKCMLKKKANVMKPSSEDETHFRNILKQLSTQSTTASAAAAGGSHKNKNKNKN
jgi:hypothetical protein